MLDKGIRQKSTKRVGSIIVCSAFCPGPAGLRENGMSAKVRVRISRIMPQTRPPFYSWEKYFVYTRHPARSG